MPRPLQAGWLDEVNAIQQEISALTANEQGLDDLTRLQRFYDLSYDLSMLENPGFATGLGDPRGQDRLTDLSQDGVTAPSGCYEEFSGVDREHRSRRAARSRAASTTICCATRSRSASDGLRFPEELLQMNQMSGPQQDVARLLAMMPNARADQLENQIARMEALPAYIDQSIALMREGLAAGVTPPKITLRDVPQQIRNQLVDDASQSPLLRGFAEIPAIGRSAAGRVAAKPCGRRLSRAGGAGLRAPAGVHRERIPARRRANRSPRVTCRTARPGTGTTWPCAPRPT